MDFSRFCCFCHFSILFEGLVKALIITRQLVFTQYIIRNISYKGLSRIEPPEYPFEAIREILFNAIIHKAYNITPITVRVHDDRITIWNTGKLPEQLTPEDLKHEHDSYPRNKLMANTFYKGGHIEAWGRGTLKVIKECKEYGLLEPLIEERNGGVSITIFKDIYNDKFLSNFNLNDRQRKAIKYIKENKFITNSIYRELFVVTHQTVVRDTEELLELEMIRKEGAGRSTKYVINVEGYKIR